MKDWNKELTDYPKPGKQPEGVKVEPMKASTKGLAQAKTVEAGTVLPGGGKETKVKGKGAATKGLMFYRYIS
jgi:hypothetical protein|tara:strand:- start:39 stop:254 length:216 start_codon:yes stop_codon:yes gene_type:complete